MKKLNLYLTMILCVFFIINAQAQVKKLKTDKKHKFWIWAGTHKEDSDEKLHTTYKKYHEAGIRGILFHEYSERHYRIAKSEGLQAHRWMTIMGGGNHPEWCTINRDGVSCVDNSPYIPGYTWLCPSRPEVIEYLKNEVKKQVEQEYFDGIHYDAIRYCDGKISMGFWKHYNVVQTEELPEYDFCYCDVCKAKFKEEYGQDIDKMEYPQESLSWRKFRCDAISNVVAELSKVAEEHNKYATAAVFPYDFAWRSVRQDWENWDLSAVFPMIYHGLYCEPTVWIGKSVKQSIKGLNGKFPLFAGMHLPDFNGNMNDLRAGIKYALDNGAAGVSLYGAITDEVLSVLKEF